MAASRYLAALGFDPKTVFDVGVATGTLPLYLAFPAAFFHLVDPRRSAATVLRHKPERYAFHNCALGAAPGTLRLREAGSKSGFLERTDLTNCPVEASYDVPVTTFDALFEATRPEAPIGIKLDTEGFELDILRGLHARLEDIAFVLCEISIRKRFVDGYHFSDLVAILAERGFELFNFLSVPIPAPRFYDVLFLPRHSPLFD